MKTKKNNAGETSQAEPGVVGQKDEKRRGFSSMEPATVLLVETPEEYSLLKENNENLYSIDMDFLDVLGIKRRELYSFSFFFKKKADLKEKIKICVDMKKKECTFYAETESAYLNNTKIGNQNFTVGKYLYEIYSLNANEEIRKIVDSLPGSYKKESSGISARHRIYARLGFYISKDNCDDSYRVICMNIKEYNIFSRIRKLIREERQRQRKLAEEKNRNVFGDFFFGKFSNDHRYYDEYTSAGYENTISSKHHIRSDWKEYTQKNKMKVKKEYIGAFIGKKGAHIKALEKECGHRIIIEKM